MSPALDEGAFSRGSCCLSNLLLHSDVLHMEPSPDDVGRVFRPDEVSSHNTAEDLWIIVFGKVYNIAQFLSTHPGGKQVLLKFAGA